MKVGHIVTATLLIFYTLLPSADNKIYDNNLLVGFYDRTCPRAEQIVGNVVSLALIENSNIAAGLIRLHFHDCFVNGCDASILLDTTPSGEIVEKDSPANGKSLRGLEVIDQVKARLENECPGTVSCADILAFAARDAAVLAGLLHYPVPSGRRDGLLSRATDTIGNLPPPSLSVDKLTELFAKKGFTQEEMVTLSGAHSIGSAHCSSFDYRLYNFNPNQSQRQDPSMDLLYASFVKLGCSELGVPFAENSSKKTVPLDSITPLKLDNVYYIGLMAKKGLLSSDQALANDPNTSKIVRQMAFNPQLWSRKFGQAMIRMGRVDVLTGNEGEIRNYCRSVN